MEIQVGSKDTVNLEKHKQAVHDYAAYQTTYVYYYLLKTLVDHLFFKGWAYQAEVPLGDWVLTPFF